jgi:hypothetical protein
VHESLLDPDGMESLDLNNLAKGMYILMIQGEETYHKEKIVIKY